jgi:hypothetical protein
MGSLVKKSHLGDHRFSRSGAVLLEDYRVNQRSDRQALGHPRAWPGSSRGTAER